jgi:hypothetical protein
MKRSAIMALVAMFCMAGFAAAADVTVSGTVSTTLTVDTIEDISGLTFTPGDTTSFDLIVTGITNHPLTIAASSSGFDPAFTNPLTIDGAVSPAVLELATWDATTGAFSTTPKFHFAQIVTMGDTAGARTGTVSITVT